MEEVKVVDSELLLNKKAYDLLDQQIYPALMNFPKSEVHELSKRLKDAMMDILRNGAQVSETWEFTRRLRHLEIVKGHILEMYYLVKLSESKKYISRGKAYEWQKTLLELKKMTKSLIENTQSKKEERDRKANAAAKR